MNILFMGTPEFAVVSLKRLIEDKHNVLAVITQPDKPKGRGYVLTPSPVKVFAKENNIEVYQPETLKDNAISDILEKINPDLIIVVAYGKLLPEYVLNYPKKGCINVHASLLPKYRGAAPINWAIINGEETTGVTTMYMAKGLDTGDIILKEETKIGEIDTAKTLYEKLSIQGAELLSKTVKLIGDDNAPRETQDDSKATYAPLIDKNIAKIDFNKPMREIINLVRGLNPIPGAYAILEGKTVKIYKCEKWQTENGGSKAGDIIKADFENGIIVKCKDGAIRLVEIKAEGSKAMTSMDYIKGHKINKNSRFE